MPVGQHHHAAALSRLAVGAPPSAGFAGKQTAEPSGGDQREADPDEQERERHPLRARHEHAVVEEPRRAEERDGPERGVPHPAPSLEQQIEPPPQRPRAGVEHRGRAGVDTIRDVIVFPLNQQAQDLMMNAPGEVTPKQLRELHLRVVQEPKA